MIDSLDPQKCTGCFACVQKCPQKCISVSSDAEGFLVPVVDQEACIHCRLCVKACPQLTPQPLHQPIAAYAARITDDALLLNSTSGGVFALAARTILRDGGVVFGVAMDSEGTVETVAIEEEAELYRLQGSKYVQAYVGDTYAQAKQYLQAGRKVLFSGTPCQIAGLYGYLGKKYDNLWTMDIVCHGVPSQELYSKYRKYLEEKKGQRLISWKFRDKNLEGWAQIDRLEYENKTVFHREMQDPYSRSFLVGNIFRESCYQCQFAKGERVGDITMGDYWGLRNYHPDFFSTKGVSCVLINTKKGEVLFDMLSEYLETRVSKLEWIQQHNGNLKKKGSRPESRNDFYKKMHTMDMAAFVRSEMSVPFDGKEWLRNWIPRSYRLKVKKAVTMLLKR